MHKKNYHIKYSQCVFKPKQKFMFHHNDCLATGKRKKERKQGKRLQGGEDPLDDFS